MKKKIWNSPEIAEIPWVDDWFMAFIIVTALLRLIADDQGSFDGWRSG